jgi:hypothetical protein
LSDDNTEEENLKIRDMRMGMFESIMKEQFQLTYFGKVDYQSTNDMTTLERHMMYRLLVEQKEEERKAQEEAIKKAKEKGNKHRMHRRR